MSGLGCVIPSNCCSMTVGRCVCVHECVLRRGRGKRKRSICMTRGCIRETGIESLERMGRAGVTNQLWESRLEKTRPLFSPREKNKERIRQASSSQKHYKWMAITRNIGGWRLGRQRFFPLHSASDTSSSPPSFSSWHEQMLGLLQEVH